MGKIVRTEFRIAWRYLFAKKQFNAIHIITAISSAAVGVVTAAMICVLSVMNGFGTLVEQMFSQFDPDLRVTAQIGKSFSLDPEKKEQLLALPCVDLLSECIQETALIEFDDKQMPVQLMGVDSTFAHITNIENIIIDGHYEVYDGAFDRAVLGQGLAWKIGIGAKFINPLQIYAPKRVGKVNMLRPDQAFNDEICYIAGTFAVQQVKYDNEVMLVDIALTQRLLDYDKDQVTALLVQVAPNTSIRQAKKAIQDLLGKDYAVLDRYEQQEDFFRILRVEKLLTTLLLIFILLIASFNIIGSLSMLIIDKKADIQTLSHLGASQQMIRKIFLFEGWLISTLGAIGGLVVGLIVCLMQEHLGLLKLGTGTEYIVSAYPVAVQTIDILIVAIVVLTLGFVAAWIPARQLTIEKN
jgi:ABC-type lipoprotein release transport system permease subunit